MKTLYTAEITAQGGREGNVKSQDGTLNLELAKPESMGGDGGQGTNPEQLFAAAWGPCFLGALGSVAKSDNVELGDTKIIVKVSFNEEGKGFALSAALNVIDESVEDDVLNKLVEKTQKVCPYSKATAGNIDVTVTANKIEVEV
ncbi:Ohr family peroxiredoxin [Fulvivirga sediminis]|uniref:Ohr family peroxiredoxin n=1 Tax=Fulvivirga sediminis TaxID=2803949 RepID=A0A937JZQ1_9BACT|nr:Ohr family peroxiredoxin [Fulvivirga sediminis]MBL3655451.1 Ohr family peroxiredoxin [Fulvivirga sediminis]